MNAIRTPLRYAFMWIEGLLDRVFGTEWNPFYSLGALGFYFFWIVAVSGLYIYIFFDTGLTEAFLSVEYMTRDQWYLAGVMRSLHRYASDGLILIILIHMVREFAFDRYRGARWFSWLIGVPIISMTFIAGISGYWLVWDKLAQYVAEATTEWLDYLPIFGEPIARNFLAPTHLDDRFFTLMLFMHIAVPLMMLFVMWFHMQRVSKPRMNPPLGLGIGTLASLTVLSLVLPATSQGPANLSEVPSPVNLDWFYLPIYPLIDVLGAGPVWLLSVAGTFVLFAMPWLPPRRERAIAHVNLDYCNGCTRCAVDCPFNAITMGPRTDGKPFEQEAVVLPTLCVSCGICTGSCPTSTPFRRASALIPGIDLGWQPLAEVRERVHAAASKLSGPARVMVIGCDHGFHIDKLKSASVGAVSLPCTGMLPPSFIDYVLSRHLADGIVITGCREGECNYRLGTQWTDERIDGKRDPRLRERVPRERMARVWAAPTDWPRLQRTIEDFQARLQDMESHEPPANERAAPTRPEVREPAAE
ncbi:MAG: cytochrome b N-terminal domain-containing protein [Rhodospirillales bacterium]|nr:cytochrome b N-terminal domain-containing protein [Rhodospirillales bacterium]